MAQRYTDPIAHKRMKKDLCPECGDLMAAHDESVAFWKRRACLLRPSGIADRIVTYLADEREKEQNVSA